MSDTSYYQYCKVRASSMSKQIKLRSKTKYERKQVHDNSVKNLLLPRIYEHH